MNEEHGWRKNPLSFILQTSPGRHSSCQKSETGQLVGSLLLFYPSKDISKHLFFGYRNLPNKSDVIPKPIVKMKIFRTGNHGLFLELHCG